MNAAPCIFSLPRHRAQVRSAEAGALHGCRLGVFSLQFRWDYFQDILYILYMPCTYRYMRCVYNICTMPFKYTIPIYIYIYICLAPTPRSENSRIPSSCGESFATLRFFQETIFRSINKKGPLVELLFLHPPKLTCPLKIWGAWKTTGPFFGDMLVFGVYSMYYIHTALLILVDSPIPNIDLLAGLWPCSKDATLRSLLRRCCCTEKELRHATRIRFLKKK